MRIAFDTNILVYAEGINGYDERQAAETLIARLRSNELIMPAQVLGELYTTSSNAKPDLPRQGLECLSWNGPSWVKS